MHYLLTGIKTLMKISFDTCPESCASDWQPFCIPLLSYHIRCEFEPWSGQYARKLDNHWNIIHSNVLFLSVGPSSGGTSNFTSPAITPMLTPMTASSLSNQSFSEKTMPVVSQVTLIDYNLYSAACFCFMNSQMRILENSTIPF